MYELIREFKENKNEVNAVKMKKYMKDHFNFLGINARERKEISKPYLKALKGKVIDWDFIDELWKQEEREFQYVACDYIFQERKKLKKEDIKKIRKSSSEKVMVGFNR